MFLLVGNPTAQSGKNAARIDEARRLMAGRGLDHDFLPTRPGGLTVKDVAKALRGGAYEAVIAMGGDGTFNEVAKGLLESATNVKMGMLPTGTANDQGRSFGMSSSPRFLERNVATLAAGYTAPLDAGLVTAFDIMDQPTGTNWFFDSLGWGISARVLRTRNEDRSIVSNVPLLREVYRDQLVYAGAILRAFLASYVEEQKFEAEVTVPDGRTVFLDGLTDLVVKNTRLYGGAWVLDPTSSPEDGEMELVPVKGRHEWIASAVVTLDGVPLHPLEQIAERSPIIRAPGFTVRIHDRPMGQPVESQLDGEEWVTAAKWHIEVHRHAIRLIVPALPTEE